MNFEYIISKISRINGIAEYALLVVSTAFAKFAIRAAL